MFEFVNSLTCIRIGIRMEKWRPYQSGFNPLCRRQKHIWLCRHMLPTHCPDSFLPVKIVLQTTWLLCFQSWWFPQISLPMPQETRTFTWNFPPTLMYLSGRQVRLSCLRIFCYALTPLLYILNLYKVWFV
jgi:hypothetical protein